MMHSPIQFVETSVSFTNKSCFEAFSTQVHYGSRVALIGRNGCGKSTLLQCLQGKIIPTEGRIEVPKDVRIGYVPQLIGNEDNLSGAELFNKKLSLALGNDPNLLILDEPTNHLDIKNRASLLRFLKAFQGTLFIASHDVDLLNHYVDTLWYFDNGIIHVFKGNYDNFRREMQLQRAHKEHEIAQLKGQEQNLHQALMREQVRAKKSKGKGKKSIINRKWPTIVSHAKAHRASKTSGLKRTEISEKKQNCLDKLAKLKAPEVIKPQFSIAADTPKNHDVITVTSGTIGYADKKIMDNINFSLATGSRVALLGDNASGKSTLLKGFINHASVRLSGYWHTPPKKYIGYLDQHYDTLNLHHTVFETIQNCAPGWSNQEIRRHLCDFLFRSNEAVYAKVANLSGGERVRLALAQIAASTPQMLILDEITNNLDMETKAHVIEVLRDYPGTLVAISHDLNFLKAIKIVDFYEIRNNQLFYGGQLKV